MKVPSELVLECPSLHSIPLTRTLSSLKVMKIHTGTNQYTTPHRNHFFHFCKRQQKLLRVPLREGVLNTAWQHQRRRRPPQAKVKPFGYAVFLLACPPSEALPSGYARSHRWAHEWPQTAWMISPYLPGSFNKCGSTQTESYSQS